MPAPAQAHPAVPHRARRALAAGAALALLAAAAAVTLSAGTGWWPLVAFGAGPDLALLAGWGRDMERGRLHPRAVPLYNALHRVWGPVALTLIGLSGLLPAWAVAGGLAWGLHVAVDRAAGYGPRTREGWQRG